VEQVEFSGDEVRSIHVPSGSHSVIHLDDYTITSPLERIVSAVRQKSPLTLYKLCVIGWIDDIQAAEWGRPGRSGTPFLRHGGRIGAFGAVVGQS